ncbi:hypothetical protein [Pedobacter sp. KBW06]|nr:hypothetical protein [Pedobacter sp. KBW06]
MEPQGTYGLKTGARGSSERHNSTRALLRSGTRRRITNYPTKKENKH